MKAFLMVGLNCADWVQFLPKFPLEDSDQRCTEHSWERGGNASNNATVLAALGAKVEFFGTIADDNLKQFFLDDMDSCGIDHDNCPVLPSVKSGISAVICSLETGSRTIIHCRGTLPELTYNTFKQNINLDNYSWIHFEGRNETETIKMLSDIQHYNNSPNPEIPSSGGTERLMPKYKRNRISISIEVEKRIEAIGNLLPFADVAFIGKDYAMMKGAKDPIHAAQIFSGELTTGTLLICPWGDQGAAFVIAGDPSEKVVKVDAYPCGQIIDSLGAGDTFTAAVIYALSRDVLLEKSVQFGCKVAGTKLGFKGYRQIAQVFPSDC